MKTLLLFILGLFMLTVNEAFAKTSTKWIPAGNNHTQNDAWTTRDTSGNIYALGGNGIISLTKHDRFGNFKWEVSSRSDIEENAVQVFADQQSNVVVVGYESNLSQEGPLAVSLIVLKYDPDGTLIYKKNIDGAYTYLNHGANRTNITAQMDVAGNLYIGTAGTIDGSSKQGFNAIKVSSAGTILWVRTMHFNNGSSFFYVTNMALKGRKLTLQGQTSSLQASTSTWVLDTLGTSIRVKVIRKIGGNDGTSETQKHNCGHQSCKPSSFGEVQDFSGDIFPLRWGLLLKKYPKLVENIEYYRFSPILQP